MGKLPGAVQGHYSLVLAGTLALATLASPSPSYGQQIDPNPNGSGNTISVEAPGAFNESDNFDNEGTIAITPDGILTNLVGTGTCFFGCTLDTNVSGQLVNDGQLLNDGNIFLQDNASLTNNSILVNGNSGSGFGYMFLANSAVATNSSGAQLTNAEYASLAIYDTVTFNNAGQLDNYGDVELLEDIGAPVMNNSGTFWNRTTGTGTSHFSNDATLNNSGTLRNDASSVFDNTGTVNNLAGGVIISDGRINNTAVPSTAALINNAGTFTVSSTGSVDRGTNTDPRGKYRQTDGVTTIDGNFRTTEFTAKAGLVQGSGTLQSLTAITLGDGIGAGAVLNPGGISPATFSIVGNLSMATDATLALDLVSASSFDKLALSATGSAPGTNGTINLGGSLLVLLDAGFTANVGDLLTFLTAGHINSTFSSLIFPTFAAGTRSFALEFNSGVNPTAASLRVIGLSAVPVPAAAWLMGSALLGLGALRRRTSPPTVA